MRGSVGGSVTRGQGSDPDRRSQSVNVRISLAAAEPIGTLPCRTAARTSWLSDRIEDRGLFSIDAAPHPTLSPEIDPSLANILPGRGDGGCGWFSVGGWGIWPGVTFAFPVSDSLKQVRFK